LNECDKKSGLRRLNFHILSLNSESHFFVDGRYSCYSIEEIKTVSSKLDKIFKAAIESVKKNKKPILK